MEPISTLWNLDTADQADTYLASLTSPIRLRNFIEGFYSDHAEPTHWIDSFNPRTGELLAQIPRSALSDVDRAVDAASRAFPVWSRTSRQERSEILLRIAAILSEKKELFAVWESIDQGKTLSRARVEVDRAISNFRYFATYILHEEGAVRYVDGPVSTVTYEHRSPVGVFALISPWNMPLYLLTWKIAPCIAFGCTGVAKPSEVTSMTAYLLGEVFRQAKLPPGVMNIILGDGPSAGSALVKSPRVRGVSFTGGTATGIRIRQDTAADICKHLSLELGGKNPTLIFDDVDLGEAIPLAAQAAFENSGQICLCGSRIYVHRAIYEKFLSGLVGYVRENYRCGETIGPVVSREHYTKIASYLRQAKEEGADFLTGEMPSETPQKGFWITPTVLANVRTDSRIMRDEIFGPVVTVAPFDAEEEAIELANDNPNGLASILMTKDLSRMRRVGERLDAGLVWVNCWLVRELGTAFGGMKASGIGREGGAQSRDVFTNLRTLHVR
ncbi:Aldehyde dehydrogenase family 8 member A1 [Penicillium rolfsii]|nr:Aldehyde dehydrogenase family 8 member A1 [Penicillium rolfsii]